MNIKEFANRTISVIRLKAMEARITKASRFSETKLSFGPTSLNLMMIDDCNSGCIMCGHDYKECGSVESLTLDRMQTIYSNLGQSRLIEVIYGGGGEPFLNPELSEIASLTKRLFPTIQHTVISNFIYVDSVILKELLRNRVNFLASVNAATPERFNTISGVDKFERVCRNLEKLVSIRKRLNSMSGIYVSIILMKQNIRELSRFVQLAKDIGVDGVKAFYARIYPEKYRLKASGEALISPHDSLYFHQKESNEAIRQAIKLAKKLNIFFGHQPLFGSGCRKKKDCKEPWRSLFINFNGDLFSCPAGEIMFMAKVKSGQYKSGNILKQHIDDIWNNSFWQALRHTNAVNNRKEIVPECLCCGMTIDWLGPDCKETHIMNWDIPEKSKLTL